jgi:predicted metal-dependent hydrolase
MTKTLLLQNQTITYTHKATARARRLRMTIKAGGEILISGPKWASISTIEDWMRSKASWILQKVDELQNIQPKPSKQESRKEYENYKTIALKIAKEKVSQFNKIYQFAFNRISIRNQTTRWGSCSKKGNLNFNYKIALLPDECADYLVVHELCHLQQFNHSPAFWELIAKTIPNYKHIRKALRAGTLPISLKT